MVFGFAFRRKERTAPNLHNSVRFPIKKKKNLRLIATTTTPEPSSSSATPILIAGAIVVAALLLKRFLHRDLDIFRFSLCIYIFLFLFIDFLSFFLRLSSCSICFKPRKSQISANGIVCVFSCTVFLENQIQFSDVDFFASCNRRNS